MLTYHGKQMRMLRKYSEARHRETEKDGFVRHIVEDAVDCGVPEPLRAAYCMARIYTLPLTRNYDVAAATLPEPCCKVKPSSVHGLGVFATRDITEGSYVTLYPADDVFFAPITWGSMQEDRAFKNRSMNGGLLDKSVVNTYTLKLTGEYKGLSMLGAVGDPRKHDNPHYLGHMLNDSVKLSNPEAAAVYNRISFLRENCVDVHYEGLQFMAATRDIKAGEELFFTYGVEYWLNRPK